MQHPSNDTGDTGVKHCHCDVRYLGVVIPMVSSVASMETLKSKSKIYKMPLATLKFFTAEDRVRLGRVGV